MKKKQKVPKLLTASAQTSSSKASTSSTENRWKSIRIEKPFVLPPYVKEALHILNEAGHLAYVVGGCVRDFLLGRATKDHDIATSAQPDELCQLFPRAITVGKSFGVIKVPTGTEPPLVEIATFREDLEYSDHRHPEGVIFSDPMKDAQRRDFTINALFYDHKTSRILDATGGMEDLRSGIIRAIGDPHQRFKEDALRLLRAIRFKTRLGFRLDPETAEAIKARARLITKVSHERVRDELTLMWTGPRPQEALGLLSELGILPHILPEVEALKKIVQIPAGRQDETVWDHLLKTLQFLDEQNSHRSFVMSWLTVLHEVGKPGAARMSGGKSYNGHELEGAKVAERIALRFKMSREEVRAISQSVENHLKFKDAFSMRESTLQRFIRESYFEDLLAFHKADAMATDGNLAFYEFCQSRLESLKRAPEIPKLIDGKDLIQLGFQPGPEFSEILRIVEDLALERSLTSKEEALEYVVQHFVR